MTTWCFRSGDGVERLSKPRAGLEAVGQADCESAGSPGTCSTGTHCKRRAMAGCGAQSLRAIACAALELQSFRAVWGWPEDCAQVSRR